MKITDLYQSRLDSGAISYDPAQEKIIHALEQVRCNLVEQPPVQKRGWFRRKVETVTPEGLYVWGGVGRGKSMLMDLALDCIEVPHWRVHFHAFMQWVHGRMAEVRATGADDAILPVAEGLADEIRLLAFDEMQITDVADAMIVGRLFEALFARGVCVITTSNRPPDDLYKDGLNRDIFLPFIAEIKNRLTVHEVVSEKDYRQQVLAGSPTYFTPNNRAAQDAIDALWDGLSGGHDEPLVLNVKGRDVTLARFFHGSARVSFVDLCGAMLGPGDYLHIADAVRVLVMEDIPQLGRGNFNEAKRFVTLIDALYEAKVRFICSAASEPEALYSQGTGAFEFERTASRLREMQGAEWGQDPS